MRLTPLLPALAAMILSLALPSASAQTALNDGFARDSKQPIDQAYTDHIHKYTTDPQFSSRLVDYLPASATVPTPAKVLGDVAGAPDMLPSAAHVGAGNVLLFANNPVYRGETIGSYNLVFNAILNYDHLRQPVATTVPDQPAPTTVPAER